MSGHGYPDDYDDPLDEQDMHLLGKQGLPFDAGVAIAPDDVDWGLNKTPGGAPENTDYFLDGYVNDTNLQVGFESFTPIRLKDPAGSGNDVLYDWDQINISSADDEIFSIVNSGSGTVTLNVSGLLSVESLEIIHTAIESDDSAFEIIADAAGFGDVKALEIDYITGAIVTGEDEAVILVNINEIAALGGDIIAFDVLATAGSADAVYGLGVGATIHPIKQFSGIFTNPVLWENQGVGNVNETTEVTTTGVPRSSVFIANGDKVLITSANKFEEIEIELFIAASGAGIKPTFKFSTGGSGFTAFTPVDGTGGFRFSGVIAWDDADIAAWATNTSGNFEILIERTRVNLSTTPVVDIAQVAATVVLSWNKDGELTIKKVHILKDSAGAVSAETTADDLIIENSTHAGLSILTPNTVTGRINFGDPEDDDAGRIIYNHAASPPEFSITTEGLERLSISSSAVIFNEGGLDQDFRIESENQPTCFRIDANLDLVNIRCFSTSVGFLVEDASANDLLSISDSIIKFNTDLQDVDFSVSGDTVANLLFVNAGIDKVGVNTILPEALFHINVDNDDAGTIGADTALLISNIADGADAIASLVAASDGESILNLGDVANEEIGQIVYNHSSNYMSFVVNGSEAIQIASTGISTAVNDALFSDDIVLSASSALRFLQATQNISAAGDTITPDKSLITLHNQEESPITLTTNSPVLAPSGETGNLLILIGNALQPAADGITFATHSTFVLGASTRVLNAGGALVLLFTDGIWHEIGFNPGI